MSIRDLELLEAKGGNQEKYILASTLLQQHADSVALGLFPNADSVIRDEIVNQAMGKVTDWFSTESVLHLDFPWAYAKTIIFNSLIDTAKSKKAKPESISFTDTLSAGVTVRNEMAFIDEGFAKLDEGEGSEGSGDDKYGGLGWRVFQIIDDTPTEPEEDLRYHEHKWIVGLNQLFKFQWWWSDRYWLDKIQGQRKLLGDSLSGCGSEARTKTKEYRDRLWAKYNLITALINDINSQSEKKVVLHYLWGFKAVDITKELNVSKSYVSQVLTGKWLKMWGWQDSDVYQARLILLTHYLADRYKDLQDSLRKIESTRFKELDDKRIPLSAKLCSIDSQKYALELGCNPIPEKLISERTSIREELFAIDSKIKNVFKLMAESSMRAEEEVYRKVIKAPQTKVYFHDLDKFEQTQISLHLGNKSDSLIGTCLSFFRHWYPYVRIIPGSDETKYWNYYIRDPYLEDDLDYEWEEDDLF